MLNQIVYALTAAMGLWSIVCLLRRRFDEQPGEVERFDWPFAMAAFCAVLQGIMTLMTLGSTLGREAAMILFALAMQGVACALVTEMSLHVIVVTDRGFTVRTFFGRVHEVRWEEIESATGGLHGMSSIATAQGRFYLNFMAEDNELITEELQKGRRLAGMKKILVKQSSLDPFNGHVADWQGIVAAYVIVGVLCVGILGLCIAGIVRPIPMEKTSEMTVSFRSWSDWRDKLRFTGTDGEDYVVAAALDAMEPVKAACGTDTAYTVLARRVQPDHGDAYYRVFALTDAQGNVYLTLEQAADKERQTWWAVGGIWVALSLVWTAYVARSVQVGRHPERYRNKTIRRYFKRGVVR